jgi:pimeloyl-ACP methyl ester carboxylesterase
MPLVSTAGADDPLHDETQERARKVKPQYLGGELVKVAWARNLAEAELIQGMLLEEGIPSVERRARGFDVPDFLAGGPRDILVPQAADAAARELLAGVQGAPVAEAPASSLAERPAAFFVKFAAVVLAAAARVWVLYQLAS